MTLELTVHHGPNNVDKGRARPLNLTEALARMAGICWYSFEIASAHVLKLSISSPRPFGGFDEVVFSGEKEEIALLLRFAVQLLALRTYRFDEQAQASTSLERALGSAGKFEAMRQARQFAQYVYNRRPYINPREIPVALLLAAGKNETSQYTLGEVTAIMERIAGRPESDVPGLALLLREGFSLDDL